MYIRCAFFEGRVKAGQEEAFARFVKDRLVPLWTQFPGARGSARLATARVRHRQSALCHGPRHSSYPSLAAIDAALKSDVRSQSRAETTDLVKMFDGRIFHTVFEAPHDVVLTRE